MNLTYEVRGTGYTILNGGKPWIVQDDYLPYKGDTMEESAQNHIDAIIADRETPPTPSPIEQQLQDLMLAVAELASTSEQDKLETQLAIAELASILGGEA